MSWWRWSRWLINGVTWFYTATRISMRRLDWRVCPRQIKAIPASCDSFPSLPLLHCCEYSTFRFRVQFGPNWVHNIGPPPKPGTGLPVQFGRYAEPQTGLWSSLEKFRSEPWFRTRLRHHYSDVEILSDSEMVPNEESSLKRNPLGCPRRPLDDLPPAGALPGPIIRSSSGITSVCGVGG